MKHEDSLDNSVSTKHGNGNVLKDDVDDFGDGVNAVNNVGNDVKKAVNDVGNDVGKAVNDVGNDVRKAINDVGNDVGKAVNDVGNDVRKAINDAADNIRETMKKAVDGFRDAVKKAVDDRGKKAFEIIQKFEYKECWKTIADKRTNWEDIIHQKMTMNNNWTTIPDQWKESIKQKMAKILNFRFHLIIVILIIGMFSLIWDFPPPKFTGDVNYVCQYPKVIQPWQIKAFRPRWFGLFGSPGPITYKTQGGKGHRVAIVDIDRRDIEIAMWVDDRLFCHRPVVLDNTVDCGGDLTNCVNRGFGAAVVSVPPGNHFVRAEILDVNGTFRWEYERKRRVWWMVEECT